jgi:hypothetical protein
MPDQPTHQHTARKMLALIALADLPTPNSIVIDHEHGILNISLGTLGEGEAWVTHLGGRVATPAVHDGRRWLRGQMPHWHGWFVALTACEDVATADPLDADTAAALAAVLDPPAAADPARTAPLAPLHPDTPLDERPADYGDDQDEALDTCTCEDCCEVCHGAGTVLDPNVGDGGVPCRECTNRPAVTR